MNDYQRDMFYWNNTSREQELNSPVHEPNPDDYDENGYRKGSVVYKDGLILDPYLIQNYGIDYARQNPLKKL